jgi:Ca-activated chloride channel homolog
LISDYFNNITFAQPYFFGLLLCLPFLIYWYFKKNNESGQAITISSLQATGLSSGKVFFRHIPFICRLLCLSSLIIALANPRTKTNEQSAEGDGIDIAICMDVSGSMTANDLQPNRLEAAKTVAIDFVSKRLSDKIAIIIFASESFTQCPLTTDKPTVINAIENIHNGMLSNATSIGDGLSTAVDRLRNSSTKSKIVILLTDGENNGGIIDPKYAKELAKKFGIKVYTVGVGTDGTTTQPVQTPLGVEMKTVKVSIDEKLLTEIANETGGKYFRAKDNNGLEEIYKSIDALEKSKVELTKLTKYYDKFLPFAAIAGLFLVIEIVLRYLVFRKFP